MYGHISLYIDIYVAGKVLVWNLGVEEFRKAVVDLVGQDLDLRVLVRVHHAVPAKIPREVQNESVRNAPRLEGRGAHVFEEEEVGIGGSGIQGLGL